MNIVLKRKRRKKWYRRVCRVMEIW